MSILCNKLIPNDRSHSVPAEIDNSIKTTPVTDQFTDVVVAPSVTTVSTDSNIEEKVLYFLYFFFVS